MTEQEILSLYEISTISWDLVDGKLDELEKELPTHRGLLRKKINSVILGIRRNRNQKGKK